MPSSLNHTAQASPPVFYERYPGAASKPLPPTYKRREPEKTVLYDIVRSHLETFLEQGYRETEGGVGYPSFVENTFRSYLSCGILAAGFSRAKCPSCKEEKLVAFACQSRTGVCPSCSSRRMADTAAHLVDRVLPKSSYRQWVLSLPLRVRYLLARDTKILSRALQFFLQEVFKWQSRTARELGIKGGKTASVTFVQRFGSYINANVHFHAIVPDAVFTLGEDKQLIVHRLPPPEDVDVLAIAQRVVFKINKLTEPYLEEGPGIDDPDPYEKAIGEAVQTNFPFAFKEEEPQGPSNKKCCAVVDGYSLHANVSVGAHNREALERLLRYGLRPPFALDRLSILKDGRVSYRPKRPWIDGRAHMVMDPVVFLRRLSSFIPRPYQHLVRYHGLFSPNSSPGPYLIALLPKEVLVVKPGQPPALEKDKADKAPSEEPTLCQPGKALEGAKDIEQVNGAAKTSRCVGGRRRKPTTFSKEPIFFKCSRTSTS
jgi:hypothetical protein